MIKLFSKKPGESPGKSAGKPEKTAHSGREKNITDKPVGTAECLNKLEQFYENALHATSGSGVSKLLEEILHLVNQVLKTPASSFLLVSAEGEGHFYHVIESKTGNKLGQITLSLESGIAAWVIKKSKPVKIDDASKDKRFNDDLDKLTGLVTSSVLAVPLRRGEKTIGALEVINKEEGFNEQDLKALSEIASSQSLILLLSMVMTAVNNITQHQILIDWYKSVFETLIAAVDSKDLYASGHSSRVKKYAMMAANSLSFSLEELQTIELGALLHDIGKIWIHDNVLRKTGPLTDEEWYIMRKHALKGAHMLNGIPYLEKVRDIVLYHHERYDGKGYPRGLKDGNIPFGARLVAVADAYDTMTTDRAYRAKMTPEEALNQLVKGKETQFCPMAVDAFVDAITKSLESEEAAPVENTAPEDVAEATDVSDPDTYEGDVTLFISSPDGFGEVRHFKKCLEKTDDLKIALESWSESDGNIIIVSVQKPLVLPEVLKQMPMVEKVTRNQKNLMVALKTPVERKVFENGFSLV